MMQVARVHQAVTAVGKPKLQDMLSNIRLSMGLLRNIMDIYEFRGKGLIKGNDIETFDNLGADG